MKQINDVKNILMIGIDEDLYKSELLEIAKRQNKQVTDVISDALKAHVDKNKIQENKNPKRLLVEG